MFRAIAAAATILLATPALATAQASIEGVWIGLSVRTIGGPNDGQVTEFTQPRILIYTDSFFAWVFGGTDVERPLTGEDASDAEIVAAIAGFQAVAGTYLIDGTDIVYHRLASLNPNGQLPENQPLVRQIRALTQTRLATQLTNADGVTTVLLYRRAEGGD